MTLVISKRIKVRCDHDKGCETTLTAKKKDKTASQAREAAAAQGWSVRTDGDFCPVHTGKN